MDARHPLFGATLRAVRARLPIRSIKRHIQKWAELHWEHIEIITDEQGFARMDVDGNVLYNLKEELPLETLGRTSVWIGEAVYNLRSALDYLVYALAVAGNRGVNVNGTQFPIDEDMDVFWGRTTGKHPKTGKKVARWLHHVPHAEVVKIAQLQPGWPTPCEWTRILSDLSNPDKHRFLTELTSNAVVVGGFHPLLANVPDESRVHPNLVVEVRFRSSGLDVVDTLEMLQRNVRSFIKEFEPGWKRRL